MYVAQQVGEGLKIMAGRRAFTREEEARILQSFGGRYGTRNRALFTLMMKTGLRVSEALSLRVRQVVSDGEIVDEVEIPRYPEQP